MEQHGSDSEMRPSVPIILASTSPRRKELLGGLGIQFTIDPSDADESFEAGTAPEEVVRMLALRKAESVAERHGQGLVIGSDTIVVVDGQILGKPIDDSDAHRMLQMLQGRSHAVCSGVAVVDAAGGRSIAAVSVTNVIMRALSAEQIDAYVRSGEPRDKAGAYGIQGLGATIVERIDGDYFTVVGLPLCLLNKLLSEFGRQVI